MIFWIGLCSLLVFLYFLQDISNHPLKKLINYFMVFVVIFVSGFRYQIGWDYDHYAYIYEKIDTLDILSETSLSIIINFLKGLNLEFQALFVFFALFTIIILWKGLTFYSAVPALSLLFYVVIPELYWTSFSEIRQFLAISIFFWGSQFIVKQDLVKFSLSILLAVFIHTTALVLWPLYFVIVRYYSKLIHIGVVLISVFLAFNDLQISFLQNVLGAFDVKYTYYVNVISYSKSFSAQILQWMFIPFWLIMLIYRLRSNSAKSDILVMNMLTLGLALDILTSFSQPINRLIYYFIVFRIILLTWVAQFFVQKRVINYAALALFILVFLVYVYRVPFSEAGIAHSYFSANNIDYNFNFDLFK
jgi:transmembrane protein EpsG